MRYIKETKLSWFWYHYLLNKAKRNKDYIIPGFRPGERVYIYKRRGSIFPLGIMIGHFLISDDGQFFNLEYILVVKKRQKIGSDFLKEFIKEYKVKIINYSAGSVPGMEFLKKMRQYFKDEGIKDMSMDAKK